MPANATAPGPALLPMVRELFAGALALTIVGVFLWLIHSALSHVTKAEEFGPVKELLGMVNAIVGLIVGYYFSRATSEARAEHAEKVAGASQTAAIEARVDSARLEEQTRAATANISDARFALDTLLRAAEPLVSQPANSVDLDGAGVHDAATHARLQLAMEVARNILSNRRLR